MKRTPRTAPVHAARQAGTRRQRLEDALVEERVALWADLTDQLLASPDAWFLPLAERIRSISEALGYPTDVESIPACSLIAYDAVETMPSVGIYARPRPEGVERSVLLEISDEMRLALSVDEEERA